MVLEVPILPLYLKNFNKILIFVLVIIILTLLYLYYFLNIKQINQKDFYLDIKKGANLEKISNEILINDNFFEKKIYSIFLIIWNKYYNKIKFGEFRIEEKKNLIKITKILSKPSNVYHELKIIDGWQIYQFKALINEKFSKNLNIKYDQILADTYFYQSTDSIKQIIENMKTLKKNFFKKNNKNILLQKYTDKEILIIASLVEKEAKNDSDKHLVSSVIFNRLNKKMRLQIDASTIFAITKGKYKFNRKLLIKDLKMQDPFNTYKIKGLPPEPICFVSRKTIEIVLENHKSDYLFYFYDENLKKHIFSENYKKHKEKLNAYRLNNG